MTDDEHDLLAALPFALFRTEEERPPRPLNALGRQALRGPDRHVHRAVHRAHQTASTAGHAVGIRSDGDHVLTFATPDGSGGGGLVAVTRCAFDRLLQSAGRLTQDLQIGAREAEVVALVAQGLSNRDVARRLYVSHSTVKTHLRNVYERTRIASREDLVLRVRGLAPFTGVLSVLGNHAPGAA